MIYILAAIGAITVAVLLWQAFGPGTGGRGSGRSAPVAPDDDPEFLKRLDEQHHRRDENG